MIASKSLASQFPPAPTAADLEHQQQQFHPQTVPRPVPGGAPRIISVEDLERQMRGEGVVIAGSTSHHRPPSPQHGLPLPIGTPPRGQFIQQMPQVSLTH